jgi:ribosomal protein L11 methyltransferase
VGSSEEVHDEQFSIEKAPVVVANILAPVIVRLFAEQHLADLVEKKGIILLSGILDEQAAAVVAEAEEHGLELIETMQINDWVALAMRRK